MARPRRRPPLLEHRRTPNRQSLTKRLFAEDDNTEDHLDQTISANEMLRLGDRTFNRAVSVIFEVAPYIRNDMLPCSALVRRLVSLCEDGVTVPVWTHR